MNYGSKYRWHSFISLDLPCKMDRANNNCTHIENSWSELFYLLVPCSCEHSLCILPILFSSFTWVCFSSPFKDKCSNNFNGLGEREGQPVINIWIQHDLNTVFDATEHVRVLNDKSSTCLHWVWRAMESYVMTGSSQVLCEYP